MQLSSYLIALTALCATSASACFNTGENWGNHDEAKAQLKDVCNTKLAGSFGTGEYREYCRNNSDRSKSYQFKITNQSGGAVTISRDECYRDIGEQIDNCGHGGEGNHGGVIFRYA